MRILDVGFSENEYSETDNFIEKYYKYPKMITALGIDIPINFKKRYPEVTVVQYDGGTFPFKDKQFDVGWSNAVLEHVGNSDKQTYFLKEIRRVAKRAFITTPNKFFLIEPHTRTPLLHLLPKKIFDKYLTIIGKKWAAGEYMYLISLYNLKKILSRAGIFEYMIIKNKLIGFTLDFVVIF
jgi:SAM-dependent methyltransferase